MTNFVNSANSVFFMSENQMNIHTSNLTGIKNKNICSLISVYGRLL